MTVKNPSIKLNQTEATLAVNETVKLTATTAPKSAASTVTYTSDKPEIATVAADGTVTAAAAGEATITATEKCGTKTVTATAKITVKTAILKSVVQKKAAQLEAVVAGNTDKIDKKDFVITNTSNNVVYQVTDISVAADKKTVTINTAQEMTDGKEYSVKFADTEVKFTATDGTISDVGVSTVNIVKGTKGTEVKAQLLDKAGVIVNEYKLSQAATDGKVDFSITDNKGYLDGDKVVLLNTGDTATAEVTYHTLKYDQTTGEEIGKITKKFTLTAVEDDATLSNFNYTINDKNTQVNWNTSVKTDNKLAVNDTAYAFFYFKNFNGDDVTANYSVESSDKSVLLLAKTQLVSNGTYPGSNVVNVTGVKAGTAYINVLDGDNKVVKSLPVVVQDTRKLTKLEFKSTLTVSGNADSGDSKIVTTGIKAFDQYDKETSNTTLNLTGKVLSAPAADATNKKGVTVAVWDSSNHEIKIDAGTLGLKIGTYTIQLEASTTDPNFDQNVKVSRVLTLNVVDTKGKTASYALDISSAQEDLAISSTATWSDIQNKSIKASVAVYKNGAKVGTANTATVKIKKPNGTELTDGQNGYTEGTVGNAAELKFYDKTTSGSAVVVTKNIKSGDLGTYKVEATVPASGSTPQKSFSGSFVLKDTQEKATVKLDKNVQISVTATGVAKTDAADVLNTPGYFKYVYEGKEISAAALTAADIDNAKENGKALYIGTVYVPVETQGGLVISVAAEINTTYTLN